MVIPIPQFSFLGRALTIILVAICTRWIIGARGAQAPRVRNGNAIYGVKWQWRAIGAVAGLISALIVIKASADLRTEADWVSLTGVTAIMLLGLWMAIGGSVTTDQIGISKKGLWRVSSLRWAEISEVRLHRKDGGAIELRAGGAKLIIDMRFVARQHLLNEVVAHTHLQPTGTLL